MILKKNYIDDIFSIVLLSICEKILYIFEYISQYNLDCMSLFKLIMFFLDSQFIKNTLYLQDLLVSFPFGISIPFQWENLDDLTGELENFLQKQKVKPCNSATFTLSFAQI